MKKKKPGLGALGIDVLLSTGGPAPPAGDASLRTLPVELIHRSPYQPRRQVSPEALEELADSIRRQGILQPVVVRRVEGEYQLIAGERRWRAAQQAGLLEIPAVIRDADDQEAAALALVENLQREDLNPLEEARAYSGLVEQFGLTHQEVGEAVGRSRAAVSNSLRLLSLPAGVQDLLDRGQIEMGHARALLALEAARALAAAQEVVRRKLSVRATEALVRKLQSGQDKHGGEAADPDPDIRRMERRLSERLGTNVAIQHRRDGSGRVQIRYASLDEFDGIVRKLAPDT